MKATDKIILPEDVIVPAPEKMDVWKIEINGHQKRYFLSEESYRLEIATHEKCNVCDNIKKVRSYCEFCSSIREKESYDKRPFLEWDYITPVIIHNSDQYFWNSDEIDEYLDQNEINPSELKLVICSPNYVRQIDEDYWADEMPENYDDLSDFNKDFVAKLKEFNSYISTLKPLSWSSGIYRTEYIQK